MTINSNDIDVYFHMRNHYKKLNKVKSNINTNVRRSQMKSPSNSQMGAYLHAPVMMDERHRRNCPHLPIHGVNVKRHNCTTSESKSDTLLHPIVVNISPRPSTRRGPPELSQKLSKIRPHSNAGKRKDLFSETVNRFKRKSSKLTSPNEDIVGYRNSESEASIKIASKVADCSNKDNKTAKSTVECENISSSVAKMFMTSSAKDHEYLIFLLRITEDIISRDCYANNDIKKIFKNHIAANRDNLEMSKMKMYVSHLCKELNIEDDSCYKHSETDLDKLKMFQAPYYTILNQNRECLCASLIPPGSVDLEVEQMRQTTNTYSLGRITECTEPTASMRSVYTLGTTISSFGNVAILPGFENLDEETTAKNNDVPASPDDCSQTSDKKTFLNKETSSENNIRNEELVIQDDKILIKNSESIINTSNDSESIGDKKEFTQLEITKPVDNSEQKNNENHKKTIDNSPDATGIRKSNETISDNETSVRSESIGNGNIDDNSSYGSSTSTCDELSVHDDNYEDPEQIIQQSKAESLKSNKINKEPQQPISSPDNNTKNTLVKVILDGPIKEEDYVLVEGPVYILKALIDASPELIKFKNSETKPQDENSVISPHSNRNSSLNIISEHHYDILNSESDNKLRNTCEILEDNGVFVSPTFDSDYDMMPQRDIDKYHHLLVDATTSVSNVNITSDLTAQNSSLLLSDEYLLQPGEFTVNNCIDKYLKPRKKWCESSFIHCDDYIGCDVLDKYEVVLSSQSDTKITKRHSKTDRKSKSGTAIKANNSVDLPSQSSLMSEGEMKKERNQNFMKKGVNNESLSL